MEPSEILEDPFKFLEDITIEDLDNILNLDDVFGYPSSTKEERSNYNTHTVNDEDNEVVCHSKSKEHALQFDLRSQEPNFDNDKGNEEEESNDDTICSLLRFNRQPDPTFDTQTEDEGGRPGANFRFSQPVFNDPSNDINLSFFSTIDTKTPSPSVIMSTQDIEMIVLNDTEKPMTFEESLNRDNDSNEQDFSKPTTSMRKLNSPLQFPTPIDPKAPIDMSLTNNENREDFDSSFEAEFVKYRNNDVDVDLDLDFEEINALQKTFLTEVERPMPSMNPFKIKTQISPLIKNEKIEMQVPHGEKQKQVSISCPVLKNTDKDTNIDPMSYLALSYSDTSGRSKRPVCNSYETLSTIPGPSGTPELPTLIEDTALPKSLRPTYVIENAEYNSQDSNKPTPNLETLMANNCVADSSLVPLSVKNLYDVIKEQYSDFAFVYALSAQLCQDCVPMDCFLNLKMALLLSLASIGDNPDRPPIPIIAIGSDSNLINYLMHEIGQLAERFVGPTDSTKTPSSTNYRNHNWIESPPILLAKGGIFYIGDWSRLKSTTADKLFKCIECSSISIDKTTQEYPLETSIWAHWRSFKYNSKDQQSFNKFVKIFGIPVYVDEGNHETLVDYLLQQYSIRNFDSSTDHFSISQEEMRTFLAAVSKRTVDLSPEASLLLQKYFVASRIERPDCLTKQGFVVLKQYSESFAKLAMRHEVLEIDVIAAIYLCESFLQNIFGASETPPPPFQSHNFVGCVDEHLNVFKNWLDKYIKYFYNRE